MTEYMNIGDVKDAHYRYKMPKPVIKVEGRGNGIKTVLVNMSDMAKALKVPPTYPTKYFGLELGAQSKWDEKNERAIVNGNFDAVTVHGVIMNFINKFVLCPRCKLPETKMSVDKHDNIKLSCKACGNVSNVDPQEKLCTFILKHPPPKKKVETEEGEKKQEEEEIKKPKKVVETEEVDDDKVEWSGDVSEEAVKKRREEEGLVSKLAPIAGDSDDEKKEEEEVSPVVLMKEYMKVKGSPTDQQIMRAAMKIKKDYELSDRDVVCLLCEVFFDEDIMESLKQRAKIIRRFVKSATTQKLILYYLDDLLGVKAPELLKYTSQILEILYDMDVVEEEVLDEWFKKKKSKFVKSSAAVRRVKEAARPFMEWLENAEIDPALQ